jgi:hypothetical protein
LQQIIFGVNKPEIRKLLIDMGPGLTLDEACRIIRSSQLDQFISNRIGHPVPGNSSDCSMSTSDHQESNLNHLAGDNNAQRIHLEQESSSSIFNQPQDETSKNQSDKISASEKNLLGILSKDSNVINEKRPQSCNQQPSLPKDTKGPQPNRQSDVNGASSKLIKQNSAKNLAKLANKSPPSNIAGPKVAVTQKWEAVVLKGCKNGSTLVSRVVTKRKKNGEISLKKVSKKKRLVDNLTTPNPAANTLEKSTNCNNNNPVSSSKSKSRSSRKSNALKTTTNTCILTTPSELPKINMKIIASAHGIKTNTNTVGYTNSLSGMTEQVPGNCNTLTAPAESLPVGAPSQFRVIKTDPSNDEEFPSVNSSNNMNIALDIQIKSDPDNQSCQSCNGFFRSSAEYQKHHCTDKPGLSRGCSMCQLIQNLDGNARCRQCQGKSKISLNRRVSDLN